MGFEAAARCVTKFEVGASGVMAFKTDAEPSVSTLHLTVHPKVARASFPALGFYKEKETQSAKIFFIQFN